MVQWKSRRLGKSNGLKKEEQLGRGSVRERESQWERVGVREVASADPKFGKNGRDRIVFFYSPGPENHCVRRTRNKEINHCALSEMHRLEGPHGELDIFN